MSVSLSLDEGETATSTATIVGLTRNNLTRFALKVASVSDGTEEIEYGDIVTVAEQAGALVWWEDPDQVMPVEGELAPHAI